MSSEKHKLRHEKRGFTVRFDFYLINSNIYHLCNHLSMKNNISLNSFKNYAYILRYFKTECAVSIVY